MILYVPAMCVLFVRQRKGPQSVQVLEVVCVFRVDIVGHVIRKEIVKSVRQRRERQNVRNMESVSVCQADIVQAVVMVATATACIHMPC